MDRLKRKRCEWGVNERLRPSGRDEKLSRKKRSERGEEGILGNEGRESVERGNKRS